MSLKGFHLVFLAASVLLAAWLAWWSWQADRAGWAAVALGVAVALLVYGVWFLRKMRGVSSL